MQNKKLGLSEVYNQFKSLPSAYAPYNQSNHCKHAGARTCGSGAPKPGLAATSFCQTLLSNAEIHGNHGVTLKDFGQFSAYLVQPRFRILLSYRAEAQQVGHHLEQYNSHNSNDPKNFYPSHIVQIIQIIQIITRHWRGVLSVPLDDK